MAREPPIQNAPHDYVTVDEEAITVLLVTESKLDFPDPFDGFPIYLVWVVWVCDNVHGRTQLQNRYLNFLVDVWSFTVVWRAVLRDDREVPPQFHDNRSVVENGPAKRRTTGEQERENGKKPVHHGHQYVTRLALSDRRLANRAGRPRISPSMLQHAPGTMLDRFQTMY